MVYFLYDILLHAASVILLPYFLLKMVTARKYREGIPERFGFLRDAKLKNLRNSKVIWVHAVSVGETKAVLPVLRLLKKRRPEIRIAFSTVTATGNRTAFNEGKGLIDALFYFPLDLSWAIRRVAKKVRPSAFIVVEKEIWPNAFKTMREMKAPIIVINGTISERSFRRFKKLGFFFRDIFRGVSYFCARTDEDLKKAVGAGVDERNAKALGNIKFDLSPPEMKKEYVDSLRDAIGLRPGAKVLVAGSTHGGEEEIIIEAFAKLKEQFKSLKLVIAPRHPERFSEVESLVKKSGISFSRRSKGNGSDIILLDTIGELMSVYSLSDIAFVGGSIVPGIGGHNLLEPAYFGKPVLYGPFLTTYLNMAEMLEKEGGGLRVSGKDELVSTVSSLLADELLTRRTGANARKVVESNRGAAEKTVTIIEGFLYRVG